jgi:Flp pilus assembly protein TadD
MTYKIVRAATVCAAAAAFLSCSGAAIAGDRVEVGYKPGALGVAAIMKGDYQTAVRQLNAMDGVTQADPARLINLGNAYAGMGRYADARAAYAAAYRASPADDIMLADGSVRSSRAIAREALRRLPAGYASR